MLIKSLKSDFRSGREREKLSGISLSDTQGPSLYDVKDGEHDGNLLSPARSIISTSKTLQTMILDRSGAGLRFHSWARQLAHDLSAPKFEAAEFGYLDQLPVDITPLIVLEARFLDELMRLHDSNKVQLSADFSGFKMLTGSGLDKRMLALSAVISPAAIDAYQHGPCGSMLWHAASGGKKELKQVCKHFYELTGFSQNDLYCKGAVDPSFWKQLFKYVPELFFVFYAALIAHYRLNEGRSYKRLASDMRLFKDLVPVKTPKSTHTKMMALTSKQQMIVDSKELKIISEVTDILYANSICQMVIGLDMYALFAMEKSEDKCIADSMVGGGFCSHGLIDKALRYDFWQELVNNDECKHGLALREGSLFLSSNPVTTLGQGAVAARIRGEPFESIGLTKYFMM